MGIRAPGTSLMLAADSVLVNIVVMLLVLIGGLGFFVWEDLLEKRLKWRRWTLHTKIIMSVTVLLTVGGTAAFFLMERNAAFAGLPLKQQLLRAAFQSVTPRTAGFNTVDLSTLSDGGSLLTLVFMFIGAGPGSTGGGLKMTTVAVLVLNVISYVQRRSAVDIFQRRLDEPTIQKAASSASLYLLVCVAGCMVLCVQGVSLKSALFESFSALGTVGLSLSVTPGLPVFSKITVAVMMFAGRLGSLSVAMAVSKGASLRQKHTRNITESIMIG